MIKAYNELTFTDDFLFGKILYDDMELCREFTEIILGRKIDSIAIPERQKDLTLTPDSKGIRLDVCFTDNQNVIYNLEMQTTHQKDLPKRIRYYQSIIDLNYLQKGYFYKDLNDSVIIFLCTFDPFDKGRHRYSFTNRCAEDNSLELNDGAQKVFINIRGKLNDVSPELQNLLKSINGEKADSNVGERIQLAVRKALLKQEWEVDYMNMLLRDYENREEGFEKGREKGREEGYEDGENKSFSLMQWLFKQGRIQDAVRASDDITYRKALLKEFAAAG